jgi:hypothetical protein
LRFVLLATFRIIIAVSPTYHRGSYPCFPMVQWIGKLCLIV